MPFATGVHSCIAQHFAWTEMVIGLATIAARWDLTTVPGHVPRPKLAITMPVDSLPMTPPRRVRPDAARQDDQRLPVGARNGN